jgi:hypothetical protein
MNELYFITWGEPVRDHHLEQFMLSGVLLLLFVAAEMCASEPLASNGLLRLFVEAGKCSPSR